MSFWIVYLEKGKEQRMSLAKRQRNKFDFLIMVSFRTAPNSKSEGVCEDSQVCGIDKEVLAGTNDIGK